MKTERLQLRVSKETKKALQDIAILNCRTISDQIEYWARKELLMLEDEIMRQAEEENEFTMDEIE